MNIRFKSGLRLGGLTKKVIYFQIVYNFFIKWLIGLGIPPAANYVTDLVTAILFVNIVVYAASTYKPQRNKIWYKIPTIFFVYSVLNWIIHGYSIVYYLWGMRNLFRFYVFFVAVTLFFEEDDIYRLIKWLFNLFIATLVMCIYQYIVKGWRQDFISGFLSIGGAMGGNGPLQLLFIIICAICFVRYMEKSISIFVVAIAFAGILTVSVIGELKAMFLFFAVIAAMASLFTRFSFKKLFILLAIACVIPIAINMLYKLFPTFDGFFSLERISEYISGPQGYTGRDDINRLSSIQFCFDNFLKTPFERVFGMGLGNADGSSNFDLVTTKFYRMYATRTHYNWFSTPMTLIENGLIGLFLYFSFFIMIFKDATMTRKIYPQKKDILICVQIFAIFGIIISFHNLSLRTEAMGYTYYTMLAIPYILINTKKQVEN